jgi:hypothetical protein
MIRNDLQVRFPTAAAFAIAAVLLFPACSINVAKQANGQDKKVDIRTPVGGIHVSNEATASEIGLPVYPGARPKPDQTDNHNQSANVNISGFGYGLKVVALQYESDDAASKVVAFYDDQLKKFGSVLVCHTSGLDVNADIRGLDKGPHDLTCQGSAGSNVELKVGTKENQHIVAVESEGKGSTFSLVYVRTHGKDEEI